MGAWALWPRGARTRRGAGLCPLLVVGFGTCRVKGGQAAGVIDRQHGLMRVMLT